jgi:hypothetical protein
MEYLESKVQQISIEIETTKRTLDKLQMKLYHLNKSRSELVNIKANYKNDSRTEQMIKKADEVYNESQKYW